MALLSVFWQDFCSVQGNLNDLQRSKDYLHMLQVKKEMNNQIEKSANERVNQEELEKKQNQGISKNQSKNIGSKEQKSKIPKEQNKQIQKAEKAANKDTKKNQGNQRAITINDEKDIGMLECNLPKPNQDQQQLQNQKNTLNEIPTFQNDQTLNSILYECQLQMLASQQPIPYCPGNMLQSQLPNKGNANQNVMPFYEAIIREYQQANRGGGYDLLDEILEIKKDRNNNNVSKVKLFLFIIKQFYQFQQQNKINQFNGNQQEQCKPVEQKNKLAQLEIEDSLGLAEHEQKLKYEIQQMEKEIQALTNQIQVQSKPNN